MSVGSDTVTPAPAPSGGALERFFKFRANGTTLRRDTLAGLTTFIVMSYIIFVNPSILSFAGIPALQPKGLPFAAVLTSTCLVAGVMTLIMGLYSNRAYAIAPGLGINAVVAFSLVAAGGLTMAGAMGIIVMEGIVITILVLTGAAHGDLQGHPPAAQEGDRHRHRLLHPVHRPRRRRHRDRRQSGQHSGAARRPHRRAGRGHAVRPRRHDHHAGAPLEGRHPARHRLLDDLRHHPELRLRQEAVPLQRADRHRRMPAQDRRPTRTSASSASSTSRRSPSSA